MPRLCSSLLLPPWTAVVIVFGLASAARADSIAFSNPSYHVFNYISYYRPADGHSTTVVNGPRDDTSGNLTFATTTDYATAYGRSDTFSLRASSSSDGSYLAPNGWDSITAEGLARFQTDFMVTSSQQYVAVDLSYTLSKDLVSTDPRATFSGPGTEAGLHSMTLGVYEGSDRVFGFDTYDAGSYVLSGQLVAGTVYQLRMVINAVTLAKQSDGYASAVNALDASLSIHPVPEPSAGLLVIAGLLGLAGRRRTQH